MNLKEFADHIALVVVAKIIVEVHYKEHEAMVTVTGWLCNEDLSLAVQKTKSELIARTKKRINTTFTVEGQKIRLMEINFLGVLIDAKQSFKEHFQKTRLKAVRTDRVLAGFMPYIRGPKQAKSNRTRESK